MGTAILRSQDCLAGLNSTTACGSSRRSLPSKSLRRKRSPVAVQSGRSGEANRKKELVMGQVKILKRGEVLSPKKSVTDSDPDLVIGSTERLGPDPSTVQKQIKAAEFKVMDAIYAGSGGLLCFAAAELGSAAGFSGEERGGDQRSLPPAASASRVNRTVIGDCDHDD